MEIALVGTGRVAERNYIPTLLRHKDVSLNFGSAVNVIALSHFATWSHCIDLILHFAGPVQEISAQQGTKMHT